MSSEKEQRRRFVSLRFFVFDKVFARTTSLQLSEEKAMVCETLAACLLFASQFRANVYGYGEPSCYRGNKVAPCVKGTRTASGEIFDPKLPTVAVWLPRRVRLEPQWVFVRLEGRHRCAKLWLNDRKGRRGFDLSPGAVKALGIKPSRHWSGKLQGCANAAVAFK